MRIELTTAAWKAMIIPFNYKRKKTEIEPVGIEPTHTRYERDVLPLNYGSTKNFFIKFLYNNITNKIKKLYKI